MSRFQHVIDNPNALEDSTSQYSYNSEVPWPTSFPKTVIGLEYDGVINVDKDYLTDPDQWEPIPGALEAIRMMRLKGYKVVILSDQGGIKKGIQTHSQVDEIHKKAMKVFGEAGIHSIDGFLYAESDIKEDLYAKPNIGMFRKAEKELLNNKAHFKDGYYVGHRMKDLKAAARVKATPVLVKTGKGEQTAEELKKYSAKKISKKTRVYDNLLQFAQTLE